MKQKLILQVFLATLILGLIVRFFILDIVAISNADLMPHFYPQDILLVSKLGSPKPESWVLVKNYPTKGNYSVRRLVEALPSGGWKISSQPGVNQQSLVTGGSDMTEVSSQQILGRVVMVLWSKPCQPSVEDCSSRSYRFLTFVN